MGTIGGAMPLALQVSAQFFWPAPRRPSEKGRPCRAVAKRLQTNAGFEWLRLELHAFLRDGEMLYRRADYVAGLGANLFHGFRNYHCLIKSASKNDQS